jgi:hypothetical protein
MEGNGGRTQWYVIGMAMSIVAVVLIVLMAIIFTFVFTVDAGGETETALDEVQRGILGEDMEVATDEEGNIIIVTEEPTPES